MRNMVPVLAAEIPVAHVISPFFPFDAMRIVVDYGNAPRNNHIITNNEISITDKITAANKRSIPNLNDAAAIFKSYLCMNNGLIPDAQPVSFSPLDPAPSNRCSVSD